jgi:PAS domain S-box-containing protein
MEHDEATYVEKLLIIQRDIALAFSSTDNLIEALDKLLEIITEIDEIDSGGIYLVNQQDDSLKLVAHRGLSDSFIKEVSYYSSSTYNAQLVMQGKPVYNKYLELPVQFTEVRKKEQLTFLATLPVVYNERAIACLNLASHKHGDISIITRNALESIAAQIAASVARVSAEEELKRSNEKFFQFFHQSPDYLLIQDIENNVFLDANDRIIKRLGFTRQELVGVHDALKDYWVSTDDRDRYFSTIREQGECSNFDTSFRTKTNEIVEVSLSTAKAVIDNRLCLIITATDITARKNTERALVKSEEKFSKVYHASPDGIIITRLKDGSFLDVNDSFLKISGFKREELFSTTQLAADLWADQNVRGKFIIIMQERGECVDFEADFTCKDGKIVPAIISARMIVINDDPCLIVITRDLTEKKKTELALIKSEEKFSKVFHASPDGVVITRLKDGSFIDVNDSFLKISGFDRKDVSSIPGLAAKTWVRDEDRKRFLRIMLDKGECMDFEAEFRCKDGRIINSLVSSRLIEINNDPCMIVVTRDLTEKKKTEQELQKYRIHLEELVKERTKELEETQSELLQKEKMATLGQLVAVVSHEIRNPLGTISTTMYSLKDAIGDSRPDLYSKFDRIERSINRCVNIIEELLYYGKGRVITRINVKLDDWLTEILEEIPIPPDVTLAREFNADCEVEIDCEKMQRAVNNITNNAFQSFDDFRLASNPDGKKFCVTISTKTFDSNAEISVIDNGIGISQEEIDRIFEPLFSTKSFGIGLGLPIVKQIMELHQGGIEIESELNKGTRVTLWFPL